MATTDNIINTSINQLIEGKSAAEANTLLLSLMYAGARAIDQSAPISNSVLYQLCSKGLNPILLSVTAPSTGSYKQEYARTLDNTRALQAEIDARSAQLAELEQLNRQEAALNRRLDTLRSQITAAQEAQQQYRDMIADLRSLGVDTQDTTSADFVDKARATLADSVAQYQQSTATLRDAVRAGVAARTAFDKQKIETADQMVAGFDKALSMLDSLSRDMQTKLKVQQQLLAQQAAELKETKNNLELTTTQRDQTRDMVQRYVAAYRRHMQENEALYKALRAIGVRDVTQLDSQCRQCTGGLDRAIQPYDDFLAQLMQQGQESLDAMVERIDQEFGTDLASKK